MGGPALEKGHARGRSPNSASVTRATHPPRRLEQASRELPRARSEKDRGRALEELMAGWHSAIWGPKAKAGSPKDSDGFTGVFGGLGGRGGLWDTLSMGMC